MHSHQDRSGPGSRANDAEGSWIYGPDEPAPSQEDIDNLWDKEVEPAKRPERLEPDEAFGLAAHNMEDTQITYAPCLDPRKKRSYSRRNLPFMVFNDLDDTLFRSVLKGNVYLTWTMLPPGMEARTSRPGLKGRPRISIELSKSVGKTYKRAYVLRILLHQMVQ